MTGVAMTKIQNWKGASAEVFMDGHMRYAIPKIE
jgi:hypothetical protein